MGLTSIQTGINMAFTFFLITQLENLDENEKSWIASMVTIFLPVGSLLAGPLMDLFGRKALAMTSCIFFTVAWLLMANQSALRMIYLALALSGIASGFTTAGLVYVSEISHNQMRFVLMCFNSVFVAIGICLPYAAGDHRVMAYIFFGLSAVSFITMFFIPESPYWLAAFGKKDRCAARKSLNWLCPKNSVSRESIKSNVKSPIISRPLF
jgi:facilitated trehalose transporter